MEELATMLANTAQNEQAVASQKFTNGMKLLAYPLEGGMLIAFGFERDFAQTISVETVLRRRADNMERFGVWMPAMFRDGSWYVVRRVDGFNIGSDAFVLSDDDLVTAQELLA
jgi:hypothetical protein